MDAVIGTAGWSIPRSEAAAFPDEGSALARYAQRFGGVEVNSSFYRPHRPATWARWADSVPEHFHGSPVMYRSAYGDAAIAGYAGRIAAALAEGRRAWCIFDNTAASAAAGNALSLAAALRAR